MNAVAPDAIVLHIGVHKTGSTALQAALAAARKDLGRRGIRYPGRDQAHHSAAWAATGFTMGFGDEATGTDPAVWTKLTRQAHRHRGRVLISSEFFGRMRPPAISRVVADLGQERVHVLVAVRPLVELLPSSWQQYLKSGLTLGYDAWLRDVMAHRRPHSTKGFWARADFAALLRRWTAVVPPDRVTAVVLDPSDRSLLFHVTEQLLDLPPDWLAPYRVGTPGNRSLTAPEAELLRTLNTRLEGRIGWGRYAPRVRHGAARMLVEDRRPPDDEPRIVTPQWARDAALRRQRRDLRTLRRSGVDLRGSPGKLRRIDAADPAVATAATPTEVPIDAVVTALLGTLAGS